MIRRRSFLASLAIAPAALACSRTPHAGAQPGTSGEWPGPSSPVSYVTDSPPAVGSRLELDDDEWRRRLTREQYRILRQEGTERPFTSPLNSEHRAGVFYCAGCGAPLYHSRDKFDSGTGWPSFTRAIERGRVHEKPDRSMGMVRVEVECARCDGHLGHVFEDGPRPTGRRHCINGVSLEFHA